MREFEGIYAIPLGKFRCPLILEARAKSNADVTLCNDADLPDVLRMCCNATVWRHGERDLERERVGENER